jgi:hypothetical protein
MSIESTLSNLCLSLALLLAMSGIGFGIGNRWYWVGVALLALVSFGFDKLAKAKPLPQPMHLEPPPVQQRPLSNRIKMAGKRLSGQERNELLQEIDQLTRDIEEGDGWRHG